MHPPPLLLNIGIHQHRETADIKRQLTDDTVYLKSPNFLLMAVPKLLKAADVLCPAVDNVSDVFL